MIFCAIIQFVENFIIIGFFSTTTKSTLAHCPDIFIQINYVPKNGLHKICWVQTGHTTPFRIEQEGAAAVCSPNYY